MIKNTPRSVMPTPTRHRSPIPAAPQRPIHNTEDLGHADAPARGRTHRTGCICLCMSAHTTTSEPDPQPPRTHKGPNSPASARCGSSGCQPQPCALTSLVRAVRLPIGLPSLLSASTLGFGHPHWSRALAIRTGAGLWPSALEPGFGHPHWSRALAIRTGAAHPRCRAHVYFVARVPCSLSPTALLSPEDAATPMHIIRMRGGRALSSAGGGHSWRGRRNCGQRSLLPRLL